MSNTVSSQNNITISNSATSLTLSNNYVSLGPATSSIRHGVSISIKRGDLANYLKSGNTLIDGEQFFDTRTKGIYLYYQGNLFMYNAEKMIDLDSFLDRPPEEPKITKVDAIDYFN